MFFQLRSFDSLTNQTVTDTASTNILKPDNLEGVDGKISSEYARLKSDEINTTDGVGKDNKEQGEGCSVRTLHGGRPREIISMDISFTYSDDSISGGMSRDSLVNRLNTLEPSDAVEAGKKMSVETCVDYVR